MRLLFVGDVVGQPGRRLLRRRLKTLQKRHDVDLTVVNGENAAGGNGLTAQTADELFRAGADVLTGGNHTFDRAEIRRLLEEDPRVLRPANFPAPCPGSGVARLQAPDGSPVVVINVIGRVFMGLFDDPFRTVDAILDSLDPGPQTIVVDIHAEATSEKIALAWYLDGRVSAVVGTHTHVPTADERILPGGTAAITDVGMTGPHDSVIGMNKVEVLERFLSQRPVRFQPAERDVRLCAVLIETSPADGRALSIRRVQVDEAGDEIAS